jgi:hypothetical protein
MNLWQEGGGGQGAELSGSLCGDGWLHGGVSVSGVVDGARCAGDRAKHMACPCQRCMLATAYVTHADLPLLCCNNWCHITA